jgi:hypothetical protein
MDGLVLVAVVVGGGDKGIMAEAGHLIYHPFVS